MSVDVDGDYVNILMNLRKMVQGSNFPKSLSEHLEMQTLNTFHLTT